jgi:hypothetical protein
MHPLCTTVQHLFLISALLKIFAAPVLLGRDHFAHNNYVVVVRKYVLWKRWCEVDFQFEFCPLLAMFIVPLAKTVTRNTCYSTLLYTVSKLYQKLQRTVDIKEEGVSSLSPPHPLTMIMTIVMTIVMTIIMMITMLESCQRFVGTILRIRRIYL